MEGTINIAKYPKEAVEFLLELSKPSVLAFSSKELLKSFINILNSVYNDKLKIDGFVSEVMLLGDRKSTRLNSSHVRISYAVFCLKKKKKKKQIKRTKIKKKKTTNETLTVTLVAMINKHQHLSQEKTPQ